MSDTSPHGGPDNEQHSPIVAVIPAHNEERYIGSVVLRARKHVDEAIVVDDGSSDETAQIAEATGAVVCRHGRHPADYGSDRA